MSSRDANGPPNSSQPDPQDPLTHAEKALSNQDWETAARSYAQSVEQRLAELALIHSVQEGLSAKLEMQAIYDLVGDKLRDTFNAQVVMISQYDPLTNHVYHHYAIERGQHLHLTTWRPIDVSRARVVQTRQPVMISLEEIEKVVNSGAMQVIPGTELPKTWLGVPMVVGNEVKGIVSLQNLDKGNAFTPNDIRLLTTLTNSMSQSLENARLFNETQRLLNLLETEMEIARRTQHSILPRRAPRHAGYDFGSLIKSARAVGGDFYDFIHIDRHRLCIVLGDVSDKGLHAALFMALTFSLLRAETGHEQNPRRILANVNQYLLKMNASSMFVTLLYCVLDFKTGKMQCLRAGHYPPLVLFADDTFAGQDYREGQPLGIFQDMKIDLQEFTIPPGGTVLLYSDGLTEPINLQGNEFGIQGVQQVLLSSRQDSARIICRKLWEAVQTHSAQMPYQDDFTTVVIKRAPA